MQNSSNFILLIAIVLIILLLFFLFVFFNHPAGTPISHNDAQKTKIKPKQTISKKIQSENKKTQKSLKKTEKESDISSSKTGQKEKKKDKKNQDAERGKKRPLSENNNKSTFNNDLNKSSTKAIIPLKGTIVTNKEINNLLTLNITQPFSISERKIWETAIKKIKKICRYRNRVIFPKLGTKGTSVMKNNEASNKYWETYIVKGFFIAPDMEGNMRKNHFVCNVLILLTNEYRTCVPGSYQITN